MKKQVVVIHGGTAFETYDTYLTFLKEFQIENLDYFKKISWRETLEEKLGNEYEVVLPLMPNKRNAQYLEWKIWFDKIVPLLNDQVVLVGQSLGGIFLAKYLAEEEVLKKILATFIVCAPYDATGTPDPLLSLVDFVLPESLQKIEEQGGEIFLYYSKDDPVVPFANLSKYKQELPKATVREFRDRGHFNQEELPELVEDITALSRDE